MPEWKLVAHERYCIFRDGVKFCECDTKEDAEAVLRQVKHDNGIKK